MNIMDELDVCLP